MTWIWGFVFQFVSKGGMSHLLSIFMNGTLQPQEGDSWSQVCSLYICHQFLFYPQPSPDSSLPDLGYISHAFGESDPPPRTPLTFGVHWIVYTITVICQDCNLFSVMIIMMVYHAVFHLHVGVPCCVFHLHVGVPCCVFHLHVGVPCCVFHLHVGVPCCVFHLHVGVPCCVFHLYLCACCSGTRSAWRTCCASSCSSRWSTRTWSPWRRTPTLRRVPGGSCVVCGGWRRRSSSPESCRWAPSLAFFLNSYFLLCVKTNWGSMLELCIFIGNKKGDTEP